MNRYQSRKLKGLCTRCGKVPFILPTQYCERCMTYHKEYAKKQWQTPDGKEKRRRWLKQWQQNNKEKCRERSRKDYHKARILVFNHYGNKCQCCGLTEDRFLTIDHINNDGKFDRNNFYKKIVQRHYPTNLQVLCWNCNMAKRFSLCPHKESINYE